MKKIYLKRSHVETLNEDNRSFDVIILTQRPVVPAIGYSGKPDLWLLGNLEVKGENGVIGRVPIFDSHNIDDDGWIKTYKSSDVRGSLSNVRLDGDNLIGTLNFADSERAKELFNLYRDGHLTDVSAGIMYNEADIIELDTGEKKNIDGKEYEGPLNIHMKGRLFEISTVVAGADPGAKALSKNQKKEIEEMKDEVKEKDKVETKSPEAVADVETDISLNSAKAPAKVPAIDEKKIALSEKERNLEIIAMCKDFGFHDLSAELIASDMQLDEARKTVLAKVAAERKTENFQSGAAKVTDDLKDRTERKIIAGMSARRLLGLHKEDEAQGNEYSMMSMFEIAKDRLKAFGVPLRGGQMEIVGLAMTSSDFPNLISTVANKTIYRAYMEYPAVWRKIATVGSSPNFLTGEVVKKSGTGVLPEVMTAGASYSYGARYDDKETYRVKTYAAIFEYTRHMVINDQFGIDDIAEHGKAGARTIDKNLIDYIVSNPTMNDGNPAYSVANGNIAVGGDIGAPNIATMDEAEFAMGSQTDLDGVTALDIPPTMILTGRKLKGHVTQFLGSMWYSDEASIGTPDEAMGSTRKNPWYDIITPIHTALITSETVWYVLGPMGSHFKVFFLDGRDAPIVERAIDFDTKNIKISVSVDADPMLQDHRYVYYNAGA